MIEEDTQYLHTLVLKLEWLAKGLALALPSGRDTEPLTVIQSAASELRLMLKYTSNGATADRAEQTAPDKPESGTRLGWCRNMGECSCQSELQRVACPNFGVS